MSVPSDSSSPATGAEPEGRVLRLVMEGYRVLAELHEAVTEATPAPEPAHAHVTAATRELAAIQALFERRGR